MRRFFLGVALFGALALTLGIGGAAADTKGPINFESYGLGPINGQNGWSDTGGYDANVVNVGSFPAASGYVFGNQALQISDAMTSGNFGDQTFSPGLAQSAGESGQSYFAANFSIGSATGEPQLGMHVSVSPDDGNGGRMSYLRFEDQPTGIHVFFDQATDAGPLGTVATFSDVDIATLSYTVAHTAAFSINFKPGPANDVVTVTLDGVVKATGTTWEDYYRYDPEQVGNGNVVPPTSKLLFREGGTADPGHLAFGYLIDNVSLASSTCTPTGLMRDGLNLTAKLVNPAGTVSGTVNAATCNIGVYYGPGKIGTVIATVSGANYYGVVADGAAVNVTNSTISNIGETQPNGSQHGVGVLYTTVHQDGSTTGTNGATGMLSGSTINSYQKNGVVVSGLKAAVTVKNNTVTGYGPISYIAQNGIQVSTGATATVMGNWVSGNWYTPSGVTACGLLFYQAGGVKQSANNLFANETNLCNAGRGGGNYNP